MNLLQSLLRGDLDAVHREMDEQRFRRETEFAASFRDTLARVGLEAWFAGGATHEPACGRAQKGDLLRWHEIAGVRLPTVRADMVGCVKSLTVQGGASFLDFVAARLAPEAIEKLAAVARAERTKR